MSRKLINNPVVPVLLVALLGACGSDSTTPSASADAFDLPADQVLYHVQHVVTNAGVKTALLNGDTALVYEQARRFDLTGVELLFFNEQGVQIGSLTSRSGEYQPSAGVFVARDNVVLVTDGPNGERRLETENLHYDIKGDLLRSETPFVFHEDGRTSRGTSFTSNSKFTTWEVTGARTQGEVSGDPGLSF
jgi:LPS export ABC transporter protein LptC